MLKSKIFWAFSIVAIFLLGFGTSQLINLFLSSKIPSQKSVEITKEATSTAVLGETKEERVLVSRVIDGDTVELEDGRKLRYIGIDTPELVHPDKATECFAKEAMEENKRLVDGKTVRLESDVSETDRYGRLLRYVYVENTMVNDTLVRQGFAHASTYPPDVKYNQQFLEAEKEARENSRGLWSDCNTTNITNKPIPTNTTNEESGNAQCTIKGNISSSGEKIYHVSGCGSYEKTSIDESKGEQWFCTEDDAFTAGWRKAKNCP